MPNHPERSLNEVRLVQGQTKTLKVKVKTRQGRNAKLQGAVIYCSVYEKPGEPVLIALKSPDNGIEIIDPQKGEAIVTMSSTDTQALSVGTYRYDCWVEYPGDPPVREPVVQFALLRVVDSVTTFG